VPSGNTSNDQQSKYNTVYIVLLNNTIGKMVYIHEISTDTKK